MKETALCYPSVGQFKIYNNVVALVSLSNKETPLKILGGGGLGKAGALESKQVKTALKIIEQEDYWTFSIRA